MSDRREAALEAFLRLVGEKGYAAVALRDVAQAAGLGFAEFYALFPDKVALTAAFMARIDAQVMEGVAPSNDPEETTRDRLFDTLMRRYDALKPHKGFLRAVRRAMAADPLLLLAMAPAMGRAMAGMLEAAGVPSDGISGALRQNGLLAVHYAVLGVFESDDSEDLSKTMAALDRRLKTAENWAQTFDKYVKLPASPKRLEGPNSHAT